MGEEKSENVVVHGPYIRLKHSGVYDLEALLSVAKSWFAGRKYFLVEGEHTEEVKSSGKNIKILWKPFRNISTYLRFIMEFEIVILRQIDVVVEEDGKSVNKQQGDLELRLKTTMLKNYRQTFKGAGKEFTRKTYEKYLIKSELEEYKLKLLAEGDEFWDEMKEVLGSFKR